MYSYTYMETIAQDTKKPHRSQADRWGDGVWSTRKGSQLLDGDVEHLALADEALEGLPDSYRPNTCRGARKDEVTHT